VRKNQLTPSAVRKSFHKADDLGDYFFELEHFVGMGLKFQHETETVMATDRRCKRARRAQCRIGPCGTSCSSAIHHAPHH